MQKDYTYGENENHVDTKTIKKQYTYGKKTCTNENCEMKLCTVKCIVKRNDDDTKSITNRHTCGKNENDDDTENMKKT